jgi:demethylmenaquinone methyltransferase/2-methoxy-6-polyprenyl-1,4-benzoquinol methylase
MPATLTPPPNVDKSSDRIRRMFGQIAPRYDRMNHALSLSVDRYWRWRTVRAVPPRGAAPILDLCTGTGDLALAYNRAAAGQADVTGADFCREMLDVAEVKKRRAGIASGLTFVEADALSLPFPTDHFQIVSIAFGLRNVQNTDQALREMARVLVPGGRLAVLEFSMPRRQPLKSLYGWYFRHVLPKLGQLFAASQERAYDYLTASVGQFPTYEALADRIQAAGLTQVTFRPLTFGIATLYIGTK